jgi:hypothetical protein
MAGTKPYQVWVDGERDWTSGILAAESASKARYQAYLNSRDAGFAFSLIEFRSKRAPTFDALLPELRGRTGGLTLGFALERLKAVNGN